jgi:hypothetical protein
VAKEGPERVSPPLWTAALLYILLSVLMTWPLARYLTTHFSSPDTDVLNVYWGNWWVRQALATGQNPYVTRFLIYPAGFDLVSFAFSPFLALLWIPLTWAVAPITAYNLLFWLTIVLCCLAMDQLVRYLTGNGWAAMVAGVTFGFAPALVAERVCHLNIAALFWIPWAMLLLTRLMRQARLRDALLLSATVVLAFLTRLQVGILVVLFCAVYFLGLALVERQQWHRLAMPRLLLAAGLGLGLLSPLLLHAWQALQQPGGEALLRWDAEEYQTDLLAYVLPPQQSPLFGSWTQAAYNERFAVNRQYWAYVGLVPLALAGYGALSQRRRALPWLLAGLMFFILALGPYLRLNGHVYPALKLPYSLAPGLFSAIGFNWPNRFNLPLMVAVSVLVGLACARLGARVKKPWLLAGAALVILGEYMVLPLPLTLAPAHSAFYDQMAADTTSYAVVDLPLTRPDGEIHRYYQTLHHKPIVGGWDHRVPDSAFDFIDSIPLLATWLGQDQPGLSLDTDLAKLAGANVRYVLVHKNQLTTVPERLRSLLLTLKPVYQDPNLLVLDAQDLSSSNYAVVHWFDEDMGLIRPTVLVDLPLDRNPPRLALYTCWLRTGEAISVDSYAVTLTAPDGTLGYADGGPLPGSALGLACQLWAPELATPMQAGTYKLSITLLAGQQPVDTYTAPQPIQVLQTRKGEAFAAMGQPAGVVLDPPMEIAGYNLAGGDGFLWTDLFVRSTEKHDGTPFLTVRLVDAETGQSAVSENGLIMKYQWKQGDLIQERRVLWLDGVRPGRYRLGVALDHDPTIDLQTGELVTEHTVTLDTPVLVLPAGAPEPEGLEPGTIVAHATQ